MRITSLPTFLYHVIILLVDSMARREDKKTIHIYPKLHKAIKMYMAYKDSNIEEMSERLLLQGFQSLEDDVPDYILRELDFSRCVEEDKDKGIELSDLPKKVIDISEDLDGKDLTTDESIREVTLSSLRYLKAVGEGTHNDFKNNVYPEFEDEHSEEVFWKIAREGMKQLEHHDIVKTPGKGHSKYIWKL